MEVIRKRESIPSRETVLIVDDQPEILNSLERLFRDEYEVLRASGGREALHLLEAHDPAVILADQRMPAMTGVQLFAQSLTTHPHAIRILITAYADIHASISAVNEGHIFYYVSKPWEPDSLLLIMRRAVERYRMERENRRLAAELQEANRRLHHENVILKQNLREKYDFGSMIGTSPGMQRVFDLVSKVVDTPTTVMILGETGTGKEMLARAIHYNSSRKDALFVAQNCGALPDSLLESELFGHTKGAFTGASAAKKGIFETAHLGTVFLDEVADMSPAMQLGLLRVLQEGEIKPVGSALTVHVDVRVIAATNKDLGEEVAAGRFREDLYYRLNVFPVELPPLRDRVEDIAMLARHFIDKYSRRINKEVAGLTPAALRQLEAFPWPGNIRELENELERAVTLAEPGSALTPALLSSRLTRDTVRDRQQAEGLKGAVEQLERSLIEKALAETGGNVKRAAELLGVSRPGLHKKLERYGIDPH
ncbi:sigma-54-dependent Fis family transcriptional regulator [bacterium]|nr:sigma-54-dependent Fis family transcriptional regulator [bacterium]